MGWADLGAACFVTVVSVVRPVCELLEGTPAQVRDSLQSYSARRSQKWRGGPGRW